jgi:hypothetical protein
VQLDIQNKKRLTIVKHLLDVESIMTSPLLAEIPMLVSPDRDLRQLFRGLSPHDSQGQSCV